MLQPEVRHELEALDDPERIVARVVEWASPPDLAPLARIADRRERSARLRTVLAQLKQPVLASLGGEPEVAVSDLEALPQAIVRAPLRRWLELTAPGAPLDLDPRVRVLPEGRVFAVA